MEKANLNRGKVHQIVLVSLALVSFGWLAATLGQTVGSSPTAPAPRGAPLAGIIGCGQGHTSHELYDTNITLLEVVRGDEAWKRIKEASDSNKPPMPDFDYVLARVRFEYQARGKPGSCIHQISPAHFTAYSANGEEYKPVAIMPPSPEMRKSLKPGEAFEGWLVFMISQQDMAALMLHSADEGGAVVHGSGGWFLLR